MTNTPNATPTPASPNLSPIPAADADKQTTTSPFHHNKIALFASLATVGVTRIVVTFDGYGDSGQVEEISVLNGEESIPMPEGEIDILETSWGQPEPRQSRVSIATAVESLTYDALAQTHCGWENNDGAYGDIVFDVTERTITLDYNERYTATENFIHTL